MWNLIFTPVEYGVFSPVSAGWQFGDVVHIDYGYAMFDWDNIFAAFMFSLDAKELAYSNLIQVSLHGRMTVRVLISPQVIKSKTNNGFVPNFVAGCRQSSDRTEPPIGSMVLLEMYNKWEIDCFDCRLFYADTKTIGSLNICLMTCSTGATGFCFDELYNPTS